MLRHGGLAATGPDERAWFEDDARWLDAVEAAGLVFGDDGVDALIRRAGAAAEQLAHASGAVFRVSTAEALDREARPLDVLERNLAVAALKGKKNDALVACPLSPLKLPTPLPATVVMPALIVCTLRRLPLPSYRTWSVGS